MKALFVALLSGIGLFAQSPILEYAGNYGSASDAVLTRRYYRCNPTFAINQSAVGADLTWNFNGISSIGEKNYTNSEYTTSQYPMPGSTMTTLATPYNSPLVIDRYYTSVTASGTALTGSSDDFLTLSYDGTSAFIGQFPMDYEDANTGDISGTYWYSGNLGTITGPFTGTSTATVDAYGTLNTNLEGAESLAVTRLKIVQTTTATMTVASTGVVHNGTINQTNYRYYRQGDLWPYVSWARYTVAFPTLSINQTVTKLEKAFTVLLSDEDHLATTSIQIAPNPVADRLFIQPDTSSSDIAIFDLSGRLILTKTGVASGIDVSCLSAGTYIAKMTSEGKVHMQKFIKK